MTWTTEMQRADRATYVVFRGSFSGSTGADVVWSTAPVSTTTEMTDPRIVDVGAISRGFPASPGGAVERVSTSLVLANHDRALDKWIVGTASGNAALEYRDDNFLALTGRLYSGVFPADGSAPLETALTPTLTVAGPVTIDDATVTLQLASRDDDVLGPCRYVATVRNLKTSADGGGGDGTRVHRDGTTDTFSQAEMTALQGTTSGGMVENLDEVIPFAFGRSAIPLTLVTPPGTLNAENTTLFVAYLSVEEPDISDFADWSIKVGSTARPRERWIDDVNGAFGTDIQLLKIQRDVACDSGGTASLWVVLLAVGAIVRGDGNTTLAEDPIYLVPPASSRVGMSSSFRPNPARLVQQIVNSLSEGGSGKVLGSDFARASVQPLNNCYGGIIRGDVSLSEVFQHICEASGLILWLGLDDKLHCLMPPGWTDDEVTDAATSLDHLTDADVIGDYSEVVPVTDGERGAAWTRFSLDWTSEQREYWASTDLQRRSSTSSPATLGNASEGRVSAAWVYPPQTSRVLGHLGNTYLTPRRRVSFAAPFWLAGKELGKLVRFTYKFGAGKGTAATVGYSYRLCRVERVEALPMEDYCRLTLEDLGPIEGLKPAVLDTEASWLVHNSAGTTRTLSLSSASTTVTASGGTPFASAVVGDMLWTFGSANAANRVSKRITGKTSSTQITVESAYAVTEAALAASAGGTATIDSAWVVMRSQATKSPTNTTRITLCRESTGLFRDGTTEGFVVTG